jgi:hypothetical protein
MDPRVRFTLPASSGHFVARPKHPLWNLSFQVHLPHNPPSASISVSDRYLLWQKDQTTGSTQLPCQDGAYFALVSVPLANEKGKGLPPVTFTFTFTDPEGGEEVIQRTFCTLSYSAQHSTPHPLELI